MRHLFTNKEHFHPQRIDFLPLKCHSFSLIAFWAKLLRFWKTSQITHCRGSLQQIIGLAHH